jgi:YcxB-like protein
MEITYTFRFSDYLALAKSMRSPKRRKLEFAFVWVISLINIAFGLAYVGGALSPEPNWENASIHLGVGLAVLAIFYVFVPWTLRYNYKRTGLDGRTIRVVLDDEAVTASQPGAESRITWSALVRHSQLPTHAFLWLNKMQAVILPFDAFQSSDDRDAFLAFIAGKVKPES